jgi:hypothetical protein
MHLRRRKLRLAAIAGVGSGFDPAPVANSGLPVGSNPVRAGLRQTGEIPGRVMVWTASSAARPSTRSRVSGCTPYHLAGVRTQRGCGRLRARGGRYS